MAPVRVVGFAEDEGSANEWLVANDAKCDLLVVDIFLKRGSGLGVLQAARNMRHLEKVVLSNFVSEDIRRKCLELGGRHVFYKSNEIEDFIDHCVRLDSRGTSP